WHDLYKVSISTGERTLVRQNDERISSWDFDLSGELRLASRVSDRGETEILRVDASGFTKVYGCSVFESCGVDHFHTDNRRVYLQTNKGDADLVSLMLFDPASGKEEPVESDPLKRVDFGGALYSNANDALLATSYEDDRTRTYFHDQGFAADFKLVETKLPGKQIEIRSMTGDDQVWLLTAASDTDPGECYLFDR